MFAGLVSCVGLYFMLTETRVCDVLKETHLKFFFYNFVGRQGFGLVKTFKGNVFANALKKPITKSGLILLCKHGPGPHTRYNRTFSIVTCLTK